VLIEKLNAIDDLYIALYEIGTKKSELPIQLRGWINSLGLYVQHGFIFPGQGAREYLMAGGRFVKCFYATCEFTMQNEKDSEIKAATFTHDFKYWRIQKFNKDKWDQRFANLAAPTVEIAWFLTRYLPTSREKNAMLQRLADTVAHFKITNEWLGLHDNKCTNCGKAITWWNYANQKPCPHCGDLPKHSSQ
jgi:hypothetical protein